MNDRTLGPNQVIATLVIDALRRGHSLSEEEATALDSLPHIDHLRIAVEPKDISWVIALFESSSDKIAALGCSLLQYYVRDPNVVRVMSERWPQASPYLKNRIMWRLVGASNLPPNWREKFLNFIIENWDAFELFNRSFYGEQMDALARIQSRLNDATIPAEKKWIYWLCIPTFCSDAKERAQVLEKGLQNGDDFTQAAIHAYCRKFGLVV